jgi:ABC-type nitrate/sulfonate/bicarbonate transport system substrate-binding protein
MLSLRSLLCGLWLAAFVPAPRAAELPALEKINFGFSAAGSVAMAPLWMAQDSGAFKKYGLDVKLIFLAGGLSPVALMAGEVPFALMSAGVMVPAALRGADLVMVAALSSYLNQVLAMTPEFTDAKQLKGKRIAIQRLGDLTHIAAREALKHVGLAESDLQFQQIGGGPARFTALQSGLVQAAVLTPPYSTRARKLGYRVLVNLYDLKIPFIGTGVVTTKQLLATRRPLVANLLKAIVEGIRFSKREREAPIKIAERYLPGAARDEIADALDHYSRDLDERPYARAEGFKIALDLTAQQTPLAKGVDIERFIDSSALRELERGGFFNAPTGGSK